MALSEASAAIDVLVTSVLTSSVMAMPQEAQCLHGVAMAALHAMQTVCVSGRSASPGRLPQR